jgi:hypothetical protein
VTDHPPGSIRTFTGRLVCPLQMQSEDVDVRDIAHALSNLCRYAGHTRVFYSVAEHSVRVCRLLVRHSVALGQAGLLHDAEEAYLLDVPGPLKRLPLYAGYRQAADRLRLVIAGALGVSSELLESPKVKWADSVLLVTEQRDLFCNATPDAAVEPLAKRLEPWPPAMAEERFLWLAAALPSGLLP